MYIILIIIINSRTTSEWKISPSICIFGTCACAELLILISNSNVTLFKYYSITSTGIFQCFNNHYRLWFFVNTFTNTKRRMCDCSRLHLNKIRNWSKSKLAKGVSISMGKPKPRQENNCVVKKKKYPYMKEHIS